MIDCKQLFKFAKSFFLRLSRGQIKSTLYLTYYYCYIYLYDVFNGTSFCHSQSAYKTGVPNGGTGNFPAHPKIIKIFLEKSNLSKDANIIDIGSGSGMVLFVAYKSGYNNLAGIEFSNEVYLKSLRNLDKNINLINGDALELNISKYDAMFFFSPFRGDLAVSFFKKIPSNIKLIIAVNYDKKIEPVLRSYGFLDVFSYKHFFYKNFNGKVFKR